MQNNQNRINHHVSKLYMTSEHEALILQMTHPFRGVVIRNEYSLHIQNVIKFCKERKIKNTIQNSLEF